jgi:hypothetical protein
LGGTSLTWLFISSSTFDISLYVINKLLALAVTIENWNMA